MACKMGFSERTLLSDIGVQVSRNADKILNRLGPKVRGAFDYGTGQE
jgi:hypothetical protein